ncbi:MAG: TolC family protein, partial [Desulfobulbaceae bacterium]|nr:TolC family protein [Desulfobulbaceae bacterium]
MMITNKISNWLRAGTLPRVFRRIAKAARQDSLTASLGVLTLLAATLSWIALVGCQKPGQNALFCEKSFNGCETASTVAMSASAAASWGTPLEGQATASNKPVKTTAAATSSVASPKSAERIKIGGMKLATAANDAAASDDPFERSASQTAASKPVETVASQPAIAKPVQTEQNKTAATKPPETATTVDSSSKSPDAHLVNLNGMNLAEAVGIAISRHPDISRANAVVAQSESQVAIAKAAWFPTIDYGLRPGYGESYGYNSSQSGLTGSVGATQLVYDFSRTPSQISAANATLSQQRHVLSDTIDTVAFNTATTFVQLAASQDVIAAAQRQVTALKDIHAKISQRVHGGLSDASDLNQAEVAIQRADAEALTAQTSFDIAVGKLAELIGVRPQQVADLMATQSFISDLDKDGGDIEHAPSVLAAKAATEAAEAKVRIAKSGRWPSISVGASKTSSTTPYNAADSSFFGVILGGNFSLGQLVKHQVAAAEAERLAAVQTLENQRLLVRTALGSAETEASGAAARLASYDKVITLTRSSRDLYWQEYT